ncbi:unnamed protein product, partial [Tilletia controversa]
AATPNRNAAAAATANANAVAQAAQQRLNQVMWANLTKALEDKGKEISESTTAKIDQALRHCHDSAESFRTTHEVCADVLEVTPSQAVNNKFILVLNEVQLDELQEAMRAYRKADEVSSQLEMEFRQLQKDFAQLKTSTRARTESSSSSLTSSNDDEDPEAALVRAATSGGSKKRKRPRRKRAKVARGQPDKKIQVAFEELLREDFGIEKGALWPDYPNVPKSSPEWPRHPVQAEGAEGEQAVGEPMDRLDWVTGRMDDVNFKTILLKHARTLTDEAEAYGLPNDEGQREFDYILNACRRTLDTLKRTCRERRQIDADVLKNKKAAKDTADRRNARRKNRQRARAKAARKHPQLFGDAVADMLGLECVEGDETDAARSASGEDEAMVIEDRKIVRSVIPEWWSTENYDLQNRLEKATSKSASGYIRRSALVLKAHSEVLPPAIPRIAISSKFAADHPELVIAVKKNKPPYKPSSGAIAENADAFGTPIANLALPVAAGDSGGDGAENSGGPSNATATGNGAGGSSSGNNGVDVMMGT